jgi:hypothetical protein
VLRTATLVGPGRLAQLVERSPYKREVACSSQALPIYQAIFEALIADIVGSAVAPTLARHPNSRRRFAAMPTLIMFGGPQPPQPGGQTQRDGLVVQEDAATVAENLGRGAGYAAFKLDGSTDITVHVNPALVRFVREFTG